MRDAATTCGICGIAMTDRTNCGGDCVWCLADAGDPECVEYAAKHPRPTNAATSVDENIARAFRPTWRFWQWRIYRIERGWEWGWLGQGWNVLRLGKVRVWL